MKKKIFLPLVLIVLLLVALVILRNNGWVLISKIAGILAMLVAAVTIVRWVKYSQYVKGKPGRIILGVNDRYWLAEHIAFYRKLKGEDKKVFEDRVGLFLSDIIVTEIGKEVPEKSTCFYVASSAVIAYWGLPYWNYGRLSEVLVYPTNFTDENALDVKGNVLGKVHHGGLMDTTMILSLPALIDGFRRHNDHQNVGIHEFSHLVDKADGSFDGVPVGMNHDDETHWLKLVELEMERIEEGKSDINPYGATNKAEFFAVIVEYYKESPETLKQKHPGLFDILDRYYHTN